MPCPLRASPRRLPRYVCRAAFAIQQAPPPTPGLAQASLIALSTVVPVGSLIICMLAARLLYVRWLKVKLVKTQECALGSVHRRRQKARAVIRCARRRRARFSLRPAPPFDAALTRRESARRSRSP